MSSSLECGSRSSAPRFPLAAMALLGLCTAVAWGGAGKPATRPSSTLPAGFRLTGDRFETPDGWFPLPTFKRPALPDEITKAFVIPIHGPITNTTFKSVQRKIIRCKTAGAQLVVFDMDTPGGRPDAMKAITEQILDELPGVTTVAYVNRDAYSAGAIISLACHEIAMAPRSTIGDARILIGPHGQPSPMGKPLGAKIESYVLAEVRKLAQARGHNQALCEGMVTSNMEVWLVRDRETRELKVVDAKKWQGKVRGAPGGDSGTLFAAGGTQWEFVRRIVGRDKLVTLTTEEALSAGLARYFFKDTAALKEHYNVVGELVALEDNWSEEVVAWGGAGKPAPRPTSTLPAGFRLTGDRFETPDGWFPLPTFKRPALPDEVTKAFVIPIHGVITNTTFKAVKRKVIRCKTAGAELVVLDMKTPGGMSNAMQAIVEQILRELPGVTTVAYVNRRAWSAGAIISLACHDIAMAPTSIIGDAMPILINAQGQPVTMGEDLRAKVESAAIEEVRLLVEERDHSQALCEGMVTSKLEVWLVRHTRTRELKTVDAKTWQGKVRGVPGGGMAALLATDEVEWEYVRMIAGRDRIVTLTTQRALRAGLVRYVFEDMDALKKHYNVVGELVALEDNWSEDVVAFLTSQAMMAFLLFVAILCAYVEINSPGFGIPGAVAILCFAIVFGSQYLAGMAQWWEIALFFVGVVLLVVEILVLPGFGVAGIAGILCCFVALLAMLVDNAPTEFPWPDTKGAWAMFTTGVLWLMATFVGAMMAGVVLGRYLHRVPLAGRLVLAAPDARDTAPASEGAPIRHIRPGQTGRVIQTCRPVGKVDIGGEFADAIAEGAFVEAGSEVVVLRVEGNRVVVEAKT